jgi:APA family basic amino acid/polyamine antiporter
MPEIFRRLHPRLKTPWLSILVFACIAPILVILPGDVEFVGTLYSFGATLSFTVAHASIVRLRTKPPEEDTEVMLRAWPNVRWRGVDWPVFAIVGGLATGISFVVILVQNPLTRWTGIGWTLIGLVGYWVYRRRVVHAPPTETVRAPAAYGPALALEYRRLLVPVVAGPPSDEAMDVACGLAAERGARITALSVIEVPLELALSEALEDEERAAHRELVEARAIGESYGVAVLERLTRARSAGRAIVLEAERRGSEIIVLGAPRRGEGRRGRGVFGKTVDYVLRNAPCRVLVTASREAG